MVDKSVGNLWNCETVEQHDRFTICGANRECEACRTNREVWRQGGCTGGAVDKRSPPTSVTRVRFPYSPSYVGWVCCWFSLCSEGFSLGSPVFLPPQKSTLLNSNSIWTLIRATSLFAHGYYVPPCLNKVIIIYIIIIIVVGRKAIELERPNGSRRDLRSDHEEKNLLSLAYNNVVGERHNSCRIISSKKEMGKDVRKIVLEITHRRNIEEELQETCDEVLVRRFCTLHIDFIWIWLWWVHVMKTRDDVKICKNKKKTFDEWKTWLWPLWSNF